MFLDGFCTYTMIICLLWYDVVTSVACGGDDDNEGQYYTLTWKSYHQTFVCNFA